MIRLNSQSLSCKRSSITLCIYIYFLSNYLLSYLNYYLRLSLKWDSQLCNSLTLLLQTLIASYT